MPKIAYVSRGFAADMGSRFRGEQTLACSWRDLVWAAITVGKPRAGHIMRYGRYSWFECLYRVSILHANLAERNGLFRRTLAYSSLDSTEKGAISYFLGLTMAKLFAEKVLGVPWLMHLDVYRGQLRALGLEGDARPGLVGLDREGRWVVVEAKGRTGGLERDVLAKAKQQTQQLADIGGSSPRLRIAIATYFQAGALHVAWEDPADPLKDAISLDLSPHELLTEYYRPLLGMLVVQEKVGDLAWVTVGDEQYRTLHIGEADLTVGVARFIYEAAAKGPTALPVAVLEQRRSLARQARRHRAVGSDGVLVQVGPLWSKRQMMHEPERRSLG